MIVADPDVHVRREAIEAGGERADRLPVAVDGLPLDHDGPQQDAQAIGVGHRHATVGRGHVPGQDRADVQAREEVVHEGERAQPLRAEREARRRGGLLRARHSSCIITDRSS